MKSFAQLFKKYRLRAEFETFSSFGDALAEKGYFYEESIFSHWQKGTRVPNNRDLVLKILEIFVERDAIKTITEANEFLAVCGLGYLTGDERKKFHFTDQAYFPFLVPHESPDFIGRSTIIEHISAEIKKGKTIFVSGQSGIGKTSLAIKIGHLLRQDFPDGALWYRMDTAKIQDIFLAIAHVLGEKLPQNKNNEIIASFIRSLLAKKRTLLILDNVDRESNVHLLLPCPTSSSIIILSKQKDIYLPADTFSVFLEGFTEEEVMRLYTKIFTKEYVKKNKRILLQLSEIVGHMPLAIHLLVTQLKHSSQTPQEFLTTLKQEHLSLRDIWYENKNFYLAINISYKNLSKQGQAVFLSLGVFEGKDFTVDAIAYMNGLSIDKARKILGELYNASLIELSLQNRYRIHPMIKQFIGEKMNNPYFSKTLYITLILFGFFSIFWIVIQFFKLSFRFDLFFSESYFIVPLWGFLWGFFIAKKWGGIKSTMSRILLFFSLGLLFQTIGQITYALYLDLLNIALPYPSLGDIGYFGSILLYSYAVYFLAKISEVKFDLRLIKKHILVTVFSISILIGCLILLLQHYVFTWSNPLKIFLDFAYPLGDALYSYLALLIYFDLKKRKIHIMKNKVLLFFAALCMQFLSDFGFVYQANSGTWQVGQVNDYMYLFAYVLMTLAILRFDSYLTKTLRTSIPTLAT